MKKYTTKNWCEYSNGEYNEPVFTSTDVIVSEQDTFSGLYDVEGRELHCERNRIGFI